MDLSGYTLTALHRDAVFVLWRGIATASSTPHPTSVLVSMPTPERPGPDRIRMLEHELAMRAELDSTWAVRPLALAQHQGRAALILEDQPGEPLEGLLGQPMELGLFLRLAAGLAAALGEAHRRGLIHKDVKPAHVLVNCATGQAWLTGFGICSRLPRERQSPDPPETIVGTLAYMAPEQTGRMNRSIDGRSDLYSLGVTLYRMLTGSLPFAATEPIEWVHCHIARQPMVPGERVGNVPVTLSAIILKLLAKTPEERYQTAAALERDLRRCLAQWDAERRIGDFPLGEHDIPDRLLIPEKLYGRAREVETLLAVFDRVVQGGMPELVLVSGNSGIGKSSVVNELHRVLLPPRALFAAGKFEQYKRDIPYSTLAQAFQGLVRPLLAKSDIELADWREALREALGPNGQLMVDLVPELRLLIGEQAPAPELPPQDAQRRYQLVLRRFFAVFARADHPLALFLDDLQWLDAATLDLLEDLLTHPDLRHVLLIGAYRDNEVTAGHPLLGTLDRIRSAGAAVHEIVLAPLTHEHLGHLVADALYSDQDSAAPLAELVHQKTAGNPFFVIQFLSALVEEGMITFDYGAARWSWDLARIQAKGYTDNVVDLIVDKLARLPLRMQTLLHRLACLGISADFARLTMVHDGPEEDLRRDLQDALRAELLLHADGSYRFLHDRVQEAAYSLIPEPERATAHLRIGRLLLAHTPAEDREEAIGEIASQLNRGVELMVRRDEKEQLAELNLIAGKRAKASTAYVSALNYLATGSGLLSDDGWAQRPELMLELELPRAECEFLTGELASAETRLTLVSSRAVTPVDRAHVTCLQSDVYTTLDRTDRAVEVCLNYLRHLGIEWSPHPTPEEVRREYERTWVLLGGREIEELIDLPLMSDPEAEATMEVLTKAFAPATFTDANLQALIVWRMVNLSLEFGNTDASCQAYAHTFVSAGPHFGNYEAGYRFGRLGYDLVERRGFKRFQARTYMAYATGVVSEIGPLRAASDLFRHAFEAANTAGDLTYAAFACVDLSAILRLAGEPLVDTQREAERGLEFVKRARFGLAIDIIASQLAVIRTLRGLTATFGCLTGEQFDELQMEHRLASDPRLAFPECWYWTQKLQARFFAGDYASAVDASRNVQRLLGIQDLELAEAHFYGALSHAASCDSASPVEYGQHVAALAEHHRQLQRYAGRRLATVQSRAELLNAEIARVEGRELDAERLYEAAIQSARENEFVHNEALTNELAARFYAGRGLHTIAHAYLRNARDAYLRWGANGKVRQLDEAYPHLKMEDAAAVPTGAIAAPLEQLDLATVIKVSQAVSGEIVLDKLFDTLMRTAIEHAGAERAVLILSRQAEQRIVAEAATRVDEVVVRLLDQPVTASMLPETVVRYVLRTHESVIVDDAAIENAFSTDPYVGQRHARSLLCLPLVNQARLIGALYLENNLAPHVFVPARTAVLKLLASQAAISIENSRLYRELAEREARIRRLVDANIIGIFIWELEGRILEANDAFLAMVGYDREDLVAGCLHWRELTPPEWRDRDERLIPELAASGTLQPFEKEYFRKDGSRVPVLIGVAAFEENGKQGVAFVLDLSDRRHAERAEQATRARFEGILEIAQDAIIAVDSHQRVILFNQGAEKVFGYAQAEVMGHSLGLFLPRRFEDVHRQHIEDFARSPDVARTMGQRREVSGRRKDGSEFPAEASISKLDLGGELVFTVVLRDISERRRGERRLLTQHRATRILADAATVDEAIPKIIQVLCEGLGWDLGAWWGIDREAGVLRCVEMWRKPSIEAARFEAVTRTTTFPPGSGLVGGVWARRAPACIPDVVRDPTFARASVAAREGLHTAFAFPILLGSEVLGVIDLVSREIREPDQDLLEVMASLGSQIGQFIERKRAEQALRESELESRLIVNTIPGFVASLTPAGEVDVVNDQLVAYCGQGLEAMKQWGTNGTVHPEDLPHVVEVFSPAIASGEPYEFEARIRRFDGIYRWFQVRGLPLRDTQGQIVRWYVLLSDVDDRKRAEVELRRAYDSFVDAQRLSKTGSFVADIVGDDNTFSEEALRIFEFDPATKVTVQRVREVIHPDDLAGWDTMIARAMSGADVTFAYRIVTTRGAVKHVRGVAHAREQIAGRPLFVGAVQDVTERIVAEEALNRARSELAHVARLTTMGELTASIAHEVKQPIAAAVTSAQTALRWLEAQPPELGEVREALSRTVRAGKRAGDVIGQIRALVTKAPPRKDSLEINAAIREIVELTRGEAANSGVSLRTDLADDLPLIVGDRVQLQQVLLNLIINGIEAMAGGGDVSRNLLISARKGDAEEVLVAVADTGPGLAAGALEQVFAAFYTTKPSGLGLGLSICRSIIEAHDGRLWATANEPRGAVFQFTLPAPIA